MIINKEQKTRPVELVKKYPKYECLKFDTLGQAARFLGVKSSYLKSYPLFPQHYNLRFFIST